jgi:hypothetical protein
MQMTDDEIRDYLGDNGYPAHIVKGGREGLLQRWRQFVSEVERGYEFGLEDYRNDLDLRGVIRLIDAEPDAADADQRLQSMLTATDRRVWESADGDPWWDFGYPRNARGALKNDLESAGLWE